MYDDLIDVPMRIGGSELCRGVQSSAEGCRALPRGVGALEDWVPTQPAPNLHPGCTHRAVGVK